MSADVAVLPRRKRRRWRPPNLREQRAIRRCAWALVSAAASYLIQRAVPCAATFVLGVAAWTIIWALLDLFGPPALSQPRIILHYLRTCWTDED